MITKQTDTEKMLNDFEKLCTKYANEDIDAKLLRKGVKQIIDNHT